MTTMALEKPDGGLGSCQAVTPRLADSSSWAHDSQEPEAEGNPAGKVDARPKKTEKESVAKVAPGPSKERLKAGATPRSPARKKTQAAPPPQPPPPPPALSEELPWGDLTLNKCLVLASLVALLGSAFQLCRDVVVGVADAPAPVPEPWVPPRSAPKKPASPSLKPEAWTPPAGPSAPQVQAEEKTEVPRSAEAAEKEEGDPEEAAGEERAPLAHEGPKERLQKERPRKERPRKERPGLKSERETMEEKPRPAREPREPPPQRWKAREEGHRPWVRDSRDPKHRKRQAWASPRRPNAEDWPPGRQKHRAGKGRD
ncbi:LOW QUALITY PROTEIN: junctional sarcoplasmic reticulum protein 1 [Myotis lucifugus]|uniref:LOW QUALITY PROTEIN: junctional sarcoplasmic reticulum protein 1 n=1 Tax=Myotis lucifugus TaxID=59463 RepID=UPI0006D7439A|nr:LOW QUALITY PROTEIN: junctional sarcoplasmic reticulum protein 1 [Myotis lucifugus]